MVDFYEPKEDDAVGLASNGDGGGGMGDIVEDVRKILTKAPAYVDIVKGVIEDPALPRVAGKIREIQKLEAQGKPAGTPTGVGLGKLDAALGVYVAVRKQPALLYLGIAAVLAVPFLGGWFAHKQWGGK